MVKKKCNSEFLRKIAINKLASTTEVTFYINEDLETCVETNAKNFIDFTGDSVAFDSYTKPADAFNCGGNCVNTGVLKITHASAASFGAIYSLQGDATEFAAGVLTFYIFASEAGTYTVDVKIADGTNSTMTNYDEYVKTITAVVGNEFIPVVVRLEDIPDSIGGAGWVQGTAATLVEITGTSPATSTMDGISTLKVFNSIDEFNLNDTVKIGCLEEATADLTVDAVEATCVSSGYDSDSVALEYTINGKKATPNYHKLNPLSSEGDQMFGYRDTTERKPILVTAVDGVDYGYIQLAGIDSENCNGVHIQLDEDCDVTESELFQVMIPIATSLNPKQFNVLPDGRVLFSAQLVGQKVIVNYEKVTEATQRVWNAENLEGRHVKMKIPFGTTDGIEGYYLFNNVLVTSFPLTINKEETSFNFTISIQRDKNGNFGEEIILVKNA